MLNTTETASFIRNGYIRIDQAFTRETADAALDILWRDLPCDRHDPATWTEPVIRLGMYTDQPFINSVSSPELHGIFDQLVGAGRWIPCRGVGTFPVRFPAAQVPVDTGLHVDAGFPGADPADYFSWRINFRSRGRALLMLILYSDITEADAPTVLYPGSHLDVARLLAEEGEQGLSFMELAERLDTWPRPAHDLATGSAGTIYLCHPFLVHAAQAHHGLTPRFMAQPPLLLRGELDPGRPDAQCAPVELALRLALRL